MSTNCKEERLFGAASTGDIEEIKRLVIDCGVNPNIQELEHNRTPLHYAFLHGHPEVVKFLLEHGANPNIQDMFASMRPIMAISQL